MSAGIACCIAHRASGKVTALASSPQGQLAAGLDTGVVQLLSSEGTVSVNHPIPKSYGVGCITSLAFSGEHSLIVCIGSRTHAAAGWARDLMKRNASGCVLKLNLDDGSYQVLADNLAYPSGVLVEGKRLLVSESWKHRVIELALDGSRALKVVLGDLPAYPSRLCVHRGGYWLCLFAPRNQLIEFVLRERGRHPAPRRRLDTYTNRGKRRASAQSIKLCNQTAQSTR